MTVRLLLVEDEPLTIRMLAKGLREQAYAVDVARSGREAGSRRRTTSTISSSSIWDCPTSMASSCAAQLRDAGTDGVDPDPDGA